MFTLGHLVARMEAMTEIERLDVVITVIGIEQVRDRGPLIGLAIVELDIAGVVTLRPGTHLAEIRKRALRPSHDYS